MRKIRVLAVVSGVLVGCAVGGRATLVADSVSPEYMKDAYGNVTYSALYSPPKSDFDTNIRLYKESVVASTALSDEAREQVFAELKALPYVEGGYLVYFFRLHEPALVKAQEFRFDMPDRDGKSIIAKVVPFSNKVTVTQGNASLTSYNYGWLLQLSKPFTKGSFPAGAYRVTVAYPNGQSRVFELKI